MDLLTAEHQLQQAQRDADVSALDTLLHPQLVAMGPDGGVMTKADDLTAHRSGSLRIRRLVEESLDVHDDGASGVTRLLALVEATLDGEAVTARLRYTRLWVLEAGAWQVLAATVLPA
ncbi:MAG: nuclear transport factor 2 family protein [Cellulomonas sp.]|nr:nuclear transport factor 2 family protein [Cellulomonas sp.]